MNEKTKRGFDSKIIPYLLVALYFIFVLVSLIKAGVEEFQYNDTEICGAGPTIHFGAFLGINNGLGFTRLPVITPPFLKRYTYDVCIGDLFIDISLTIFAIFVISKIVIYLFSLYKSNENRGEQNEKEE